MPGDASVRLETTVERRVSGFAAACRALGVLRAYKLNTYSRVFTQRSDTCIIRLHTYSLSLATPPEYIPLINSPSPMRVAPPQNCLPQSLHCTSGVVVSSLPVTVTVAQSLPGRIGTCTGALRFLPLPAAWKGCSSPVVRGASAAAAGSGVGADISSVGAGVFRSSVGEGLNSGHWRACIQEYAEYGHVFSHGSNTCINT